MGVSVDAKHHPQGVPSGVTDVHSSISKHRLAPARSRCAAELPSRGPILFLAERGKASSGRESRLPTAGASKVGRSPPDAPTAMEWIDEWVPQTHDSLLRPDAARGHQYAIPRSGRLTLSHPRNRAFMGRPSRKCSILQRRKSACTSGLFFPPDA